MKRAYTLLEMVVVITIISIVFSILLPIYNTIKKRIEYREASGVVKLIRAGAKYYDLKYSIDYLSIGPAAWVDLLVKKPSGSHLVYEIEDTLGTKYMTIRNQNNNLLYSYQLPNGPGSKEAHDDAQYLPVDLP